MGPLRHPVWCSRRTETRHRDRSEHMVQNGWWLLLLDHRLFSVSLILSAVGEGSREWSPSVHFSLPPYGFSIFTIWKPLCSCLPLLVLLFVLSYFYSFRSYQNIQSIISHLSFAGWDKTGRAFWANISQLQQLTSRWAEYFQLMFELNLLGHRLLEPLQIINSPLEKMKNGWN